MKIRSQGNGCYWISDDEAKLPFNEVDRGGAPPTEIECFHMGNGLVLPHTQKVQIDSLLIAGVGEFHAEAERGYTGKSHRYGVYVEHETRPRSIVVLQWCGTGMSGYRFDGCGSIPFWTFICNTTSRQSIWDLCNTVVHAYRAGHNAASDRLTQAFFEKRLRVKRSKGHARVIEIPREATA